MTTRLTTTAMAALLASAVALPAQSQDLGDEIVYATTGGLMRNMLEEHMYRPFQERTGVEVIPFDIEVPDQWARAEAMTRSGDVEFDIVTATGPDLIEKANILHRIDCEALENVMEHGVEGACEPYGVARTTGGMLIAYDKEKFPDGGPQNWADFWDVERFPGPRGLPDTGDRDWWVPAVALLADGVPADELFPMDLDRAYAKLDEIKPHVAVWWKTGNQVQQIMRDKEVAMTMAYSGRALATIKEGAPWEQVWTDAVRDTGYMSILKDAPNVPGALAFIDYFYENAEKHPLFMREVNYATSSKTGLEMMPEEERNLYATAPANYDKLVKPDFQWIGENREELRERWLNWITQ